MFQAILKILLVLLIIVLVIKSIRIIQPQHVGLKVTLGRYNGHELSSGLHFVIPFIQRIEIVNKAQIPADLDEQVVITKDNAEVKCTLSMVYHVTNAESFAFKNADSVLSVKQQTRASLRGIIGEKDLNDILSQQGTINSALQADLDDITDPYGVKVDRINIDSILPSEAVQKSMEKQLTADREKTAQVTKANGDAEATRTRADAKLYQVEKETDAKVYNINKEAEAEANRIKSVNEALGNASENYFKDQSIKAVKEFAKGNANTLVIPSDVMNDIGKLPIDAKVVEASISKKTDKKTTSKSNKTEN